MNYKQEIQRISKKAWKKFPNQITIDLIQEADQLLHNDKDEANLRDDVGALSYEIENVLQILNPDLKYDKELLTGLRESLDEWRASIEFVNKSLGIPPEGVRP